MLTIAHVPPEERVVLKDLGQGFYFGQPTERPMAVDPRVFLKRV